eukprot:1144593-Pelagomonas_calceolata.AAC.1
MVALIAGVMIHALDCHCIGAPTQAGLCRDSIGYWCTGAPILDSSQDACFTSGFLFVHGVVCALVPPPRLDCAVTFCRRSCGSRQRTACFRLGQCVCKELPGTPRGTKGTVEVVWTGARRSGVVSGVAGDVQSHRDWNQEERCCVRSSRSSCIAALTLMSRPCK